MRDNMVETLLDYACLPFNFLEDRMHGEELFLMIDIINGGIDKIDWSKYPICTLISVFMHRI